MKKQILILALMTSAISWATQYVKITDVNKLQSGDTIIWVSEADSVATGSFSSTSKKIDATKIIIQDSTVIANSVLKEIVLTKGEGTWTMKIGSTSLGVSSDGKDFKSNGTKTWTLDIRDGDAWVQSTVAVNSIYPKIFYNKGSKIFRPYVSNTMAPIQIYRKVPTQDTPDTTQTDTITPPTPPTPIEGDTVTWKQVQYLSALTEGAKVFIGTAAKDYVLGLYDHSVAKSNIHGQEAVYLENRREVTASDVYAYTVHRDGERFYFEGSDGKYLYLYNTNNNLSSSEDLNNQSKWTLSVEDRYGVVTMKSVYSSSFRVYFNKTAASPLFCTYTSSPATDANIADIVFYSDKASDWVEYVPNPQLTILLGKDTVTDKVDWGQVAFDDSWGTETNPYEESKTLSFVTKDIEEDILLSLYEGKAFSLVHDRVAGKGGTASIQFSTDAKGTYADTLYVQTADSIIKIYLTAQAVDVEEILPKLTLSTTSIYLNPNIENDLTAYADMTFSVENLAKNLYIKWEKGEIPSWQNQPFTIMAGNEAAELAFGEATNMGTIDRTDEDILFEIYAYQEGTFVSDLCFYSYKEGSKVDLAFEQRVTVTVKVDRELKPIDPPAPTGLNGTKSGYRNGKILYNGRIIIKHNGHYFSPLGQPYTKHQTPDTRH